MATAEFVGSVICTLLVESTTNDVPTQTPALFPPPITSQYVPGAIPVTTVVSTVDVSRLIATNPFVPRENAIAFAPLSHQWLTSVPATTLRNRTMFRIDGSRCSHTHSPSTAVSRLDVQVTLLVLPFESDGGPIEFSPGHAKAKRDRIDG